MRRLIVAGFAWLDRIEPEPVLRIGAGATAAKALKCAVAAARIRRMRVPPRPVRLPNLDQRVGNRIAGAIEHAALNADPLSFDIAFRHLAAGDGGQVLLETVLFR